MKSFITVSGEQDLIGRSATVNDIVPVNVEGELNDGLILATVPKKHAAVDILLKTGVFAFNKSMHFTVKDHAFAGKYDSKHFDRLKEMGFSVEHASRIEGIVLKDAEQVLECELQQCHEAGDDLIVIGKILFKR